MRGGGAFWIGLVWTALFTAILISLLVSNVL